MVYSYPQRIYRGMAKTMKRNEIMKIQKKHVLLFIFCACLILDCYSIVAFSDLKKFLPLALQNVYRLKWLARDIAFDVMSLLALWLLDYNDLCSKRKERILFVVIILFDVMTWIEI